MTNVFRFPCYGRFFYYFLAANVIIWFIYFYTSKPTIENHHSHTQNLTSLAHVIDTPLLLSYIRTKCKKHGMITARNHYRYPNNFPKAYNIVIPEYKILYIANPKTGSTSFKKFINRLEGDIKPYDEMIHVHRQPNRLSFDRYKNIFDMPEVELLQKKLFVVAFVRNPLIRLVSGFRDKIIRGNYDSLLSEEEETEEIKFRKFVRTFSTRRADDEHFSAQWKRMEVCSFPYDLLGQTETTNENIATLMQATQIQGVEYPGSRTDTGKDSESSYVKALQLLGTLTSRELQEIYRFYEMDFELLGYTKLGHPNFPFIDLNQ